MNLDEIRQRLDRSLAEVHFGTVGPSGFERYDAGSGVLIRLAGQEFVLTAAHNVFNKDARAPESAITVRVPPRILGIAARLGDGSVARAWHAPALPNGDVEPDVAVLELGQAVLRSDREPFEEEEIAYLPPDAPSRSVLLAGFPLALQKKDINRKLEGFGRVLQLDGTPAIITASTIAGRRGVNEPANGRGVHVLLSIRDANGSPRNVPHPLAMSGGPLVVPEGRGLLVGLARARDDHEDGHDEWCEPAVEAIRLLVDHPNDGVAAAARRVLDRTRG